MQPKWARTAVQTQRQQNWRMLAEVTAGLTAPQKELSPKYFYDHRGSDLFEEITRLPEYYPTRTERSLLQGWMPDLISELGTRTLVELGAGSAEKSRIILRAMRAARTAVLYVPIDVSASFLNQTATRLRREYPGLAVEPAVADISEEFELPSAVPHPALYAFLGGTIGNFYPVAAIQLLKRVRSAMRSSDRFLMGVDLRKDVGLIEAAYNDSRGVTAEFNRNMLRVLNRELRADFDVERFEHVAFFDADHEWIEMRLRARRECVVEIAGLGLTVRFARGEEMRTEISAKFTGERVECELAGAGLVLEDWWTDARGMFGLSSSRPR
jgi:L-histidine N-alpha-methyltransferase